jgi:aspartyl/glutamyl-tRNA(Asn/Gln) amidotransferase C subunit
MNLTAQFIEEMAKLSRLKLTEAEKNDYSKELNEVFDYIDKLLDVNTDDVKGTDLINVLHKVHIQE